MAPLKARQGACVVGLFDDKAKLDAIFNRPSKYPPYVVDLNEGEVQAIFNRCLAAEDSKHFSAASLFPPSHGYDRFAEQIIKFDSDLLLKNEKSIRYLYGQLHLVHTFQTAKRVTIDDYNMTYSGNHWTRDKATMLQFLYLGVTKEINSVLPFNAKDSTSILNPPIAPTFSPKDPAFPAWWEAHKAEWEG